MGRKSERIAVKKRKKWCLEIDQNLKWKKNELFGVTFWLMAQL